MSKQRRRRIKRTKHTRSHRSFVRNGVEQLESRVLPGGFLDLLAGAAFASNFDLLPDEQLIPEEVETESHASVPRTRSTHSILQVGLSLPDIGIELSEDRVEPDPSSETFEFSTASPATKSLPATSLIDSFFASNEFVTPSLNLLITPSSPPFLSAPSFSSPISQLGAGVGIGSGQGYNVTGSELPMPNVVVPVGSVSSMPAWMLGEGEGGATASGSVISVASGSGTPSATSSATSSAIGSGVTTTMVSATATASATGTTRTVSSCEGVPTVAAPSVIRYSSTTTGTPQPEGWDAPWTTLDDETNEGVVVGNSAWNEDDDFMTPIGLPFVDQSFLAWAEVSQHRTYVEWVHARSRGNEDLEPRPLKFKWTHSESHSSISTTSASVSAAIEGKLGSIGTEVSATLQTNVSSSSSVEEEETYTVPACHVKSLYDQYEISEVKVEYVFYHDNGIFGFSKEHSTVTIVSSKYLGNTTKVASGNIVTHTVTV